MTNSLTAGEQSKECVQGLKMEGLDMGEQGSRAVNLKFGDETRIFDIDDPHFPDWAEAAALESGGYPYKKKMKPEDYEAALYPLRIELVKVQSWLQATGERVLALFEGRDAAGKGGSIATMLAYMNPRSARHVALAKPTETEHGQWYFQRYIAEFPAAGEFVAFDRSWYNRAGVEPVMGFCTSEQYENFMNSVPPFEKMVAKEGIYFFKFWLDIGREMQLKRFHDRRHDPLKIWKLSQMDIAALSKWSDYTKMRDRMLKETDTKHAPWTVICANDKRRARINLIRHILLSLDYDGKDEKAIGEIDKQILNGPGLLND
jgi:polyphosphate kinase